MELFPVYGLICVLIFDCFHFNTLVEGGDRNRGKNQNRNPPSVEDSGRTEHGPCASTRQTCQNFNLDVADLINSQILEELKASYAYQSMGVYFGRDDKALRGFSKFFHTASDEERKHAEMFTDYLNQRGGNLELFNIPKPVNSEWGSALEAVNVALQMERNINNKLLDLHWLAQQKNDPHLTNFLETNFLTEQVDSIKQFSDFSTILTRFSADPVGEHIFDQELYDGKR